MITTRTRTPAQWRELARQFESGSFRPKIEDWERLIRDFDHDVELATGTKEILALAKFMIAVERKAIQARRERRAAAKAEAFARRLAAPDGP